MLSLCVDYICAFGKRDILTKAEFFNQENLTTELLISPDYPTVSVRKNVKDHFDEGMANSKMTDIQLYRRVIKHLISDDDVWLRYLTSKDMTPFESMAQDHGEFIGAATGKC